MNKYGVFIDGSSGTTGLKIREFLSERKDISVIHIPEEKRHDTESRLRCIEEADVSILCLPDKEAEAIGNLIPEKCRVIDTSTVHRTSPGWIYGLPELKPMQRKMIAQATRVANPGCHATGFILLAAPLISEGILDKACLLSAFSLTGYSGGGKKMIRDYESEERSKNLDSPGIYGLGQNHKHLKEMMQYTGLDEAPVFLPMVSDYYSGMLMNIPIHRQMLKKGLQIPELLDFYKKYYENAEAVKVNGKQQDSTLYAADFAGRSDLEIVVCGNTERMVLSARYDNLGKGASAAAVQNLDLMLGITR